MAAGGSVPGVLRFDGSRRGDDRDAARAPATAARGASLLAMDGASATLAKPYLGIVPAYASALVFERETIATARDLDGLIVTEIPWIVTPNAPQFATLAASASSRVRRSRACTRSGSMRSASRAAFRDGAPERFSLEGATGQVDARRPPVRARRPLRACSATATCCPLDGPR